MDQKRSYAGVGRGVRRRGTPIPVLPPRVPTPMPATVPRSTPSPLNTSSLKAGQQYLEDNVQAWIKPQIYSKVDQDAVASNNYIYEMKTKTVLPNGYHLYHHHNNNIPQHQAANNVEYVVTMTKCRGSPQRSPALVSSHGREDGAANATSSPASYNDESGRGRAPRAPKMKHHHRSDSSARNSVVFNNSVTFANGNQQAMARSARSVSKSPVNHSPANYQQQLSSSSTSKSVCSKRYHHHHHDVGLSQTLYSQVPGTPAQSSAAAAFFARAAQKLNLSTSPHHKHHADDVDGSGFAAAIRQSPPPVPPALLRRIGVKEVTGVGKVKVMLRVCSGSAPGTSSTPNCNGTSSSFFSIDARKKQVTLFDPAACGGSSAPEDRRVGVAAPKMFAFDAIFSQDDSQTEICSSALTDVIHAVINGTDGCLFCFGHARLGKTYTMVGSPESAHTLGVIPCAIYWLFRGINEQKQKTGARFSVRVSAVEVSSHHLRDLLAAHATDSEQSPGVYLRDDPLFGTQLQNQSELRVPSAEKAAFYLDAALHSREGGGKDSHFLYTLHVYQYSVADRGGVAGGRSRLHLIDLASCERARSSGGLPLSGLGNVLLAIFNGQKHLPYREHRITHLLKECLSSLTCHAAMIVHVSPYAQHYTDTLATVQLASRIHRMRRRKIKFVGGSTGCGRSSSEEVVQLQAQENGQSTGSSDVEPSSSEQSADTVIYVGPTDDATDGEHPPVYIPSLNCAVGNGPSTSPQHFSNGNSSPSHRNTVRHSTQSPSAVKTILSNNNNSCKSSPVRNCKNSSNRPMSVSLANQQSPSQSNKVLTSDTISGSDEQWIDGPRISKSKVAEARHLLKDCNKKRETWIDGPLQVVKLPGGGHSNGSYGFMDSHKKSMIRKWVENQMVQIQKHLPVESTSTSLSPMVNSSQEPTVVATEERLTSRSPENVQENIKDEGVLSDLSESVMIGLGKKSADRTEEANDIDRVNNRVKRSVHQDPVHENNVEGGEKIKEGPGCKRIHSEEVMKVRILASSPSMLLQPHNKDLDISLVDLGTHVEILDTNLEDGSGVADDEEIEIIEVEEPTEPVPMQDSCLQVTEEDIALCMAKVENPLPEVDQESSEEHPLRVLSQENLTVVSTFTDSLSVISDMERTLHQHRFAVPPLLDHPLHCHRPFSAYTFPDEYMDHHSDLCLSSDNLKRKTSAEADRNKLSESQKRLDQLAQLHKMYKNKLTYASIQNTNNQVQPLQCRPPQHYHSLSLTNMFDDTGGSDSMKPDIHYIENSSIYSEPMYNNHPQTESQRKICDNCKLSLNQTSATNILAPCIISDSRNQYLGCSNFGIYNHDSAWFSCKTSCGKCNISSLRHPDGASNPSLKEEVRRLPGNGASASDPEEEISEPRVVVSTVMGKSCANGCEDVKPQVLPSALSTSPSSRLHRRLFGKACARLGLSARLKSSPQTAPEEYDSGHDSGSPQPVKVRSKTRPECGSLGYESVVLDSQSSSFSSSQDSDLHDPGVRVLQYCREDVERLERQWTEVRQRRIRELYQEQKELEKELAAAKHRLIVPSDKWSCESHTEVALDHQDTLFLEALQRETKILRQRVETCKSHILMVTCFDSLPRRED